MPDFKSGSGSGSEINNKAGFRSGKKNFGSPTLSLQNIERVAYYEIEKENQVE
jgi:hypothetical protein